MGPKYGVKGRGPNAARIVSGSNSISDRKLFNSRKRFGLDHLNLGVRRENKGGKEAKNTDYCSFTTQ